MSDVDRLWELQTVLTQINQVQRQIETKPEGFEGIDREYQSANEAMARLQRELDKLSRDRRRADQELVEQREILKKYQGQLMQVKNQQQYAAAWKEIDATRKHVKELEESVLESMKRSETIQNELDARKLTNDDLQARYDSGYQQWQNSLGDLKKEAIQLRARVEAIEATIPERLKIDFYRISEKRQGIAMTVVERRACRVCRTRVGATVAQQLKRGEIARCEGCQRFLYMPIAHNLDVSPERLAKLLAGIVLSDRTRLSLLEQPSSAGVLDYLRSQKRDDAAGVAELARREIAFEPDPLWLAWITSIHRDRLTEIGEELLSIAGQSMPE